MNALTQNIQLDVQVRREENETLVLSLRGDLVESTRRGLTRTVLGSFDPQRDRLVALDCNQLTQIDEEGISALVGVLKLLARHGSVPMALIAVQEPVARVLERYRLFQLLRRFDTVEDAAELIGTRPAPLVEKQPEVRYKICECDTYNGEKICLCYQPTEAEVKAAGIVLPPTAKVWIA